MENYYEGITDLYTQDGVHYAIPKDHDTIAVIYNKAIFDKYGIDYPTGDWTWQNFADIAQEITEKGQADGIYGTYCNVSGNQDFWYNLVYSYGGEIVNEEKTASGLDEPETIEAMNFLADEILPARRALLHLQRPGLGGLLRHREPRRGLVADLRLLLRGRADQTV